MMKRGFTLIELLIVVAIIGILAAIVIPNYLTAQVKARVARSQADVKTTTNAIMMYRVDHNALPPFVLNRGTNPVIKPKHLTHLSYLTTPVSYLNAGQMYSPFGTQAGYWYYNWEYFVEQTGKPRIFYFNNDKVPEPTTWMVSSLGPAFLKFPYQVYGENDLIMFHDYNPSNGIISAGIIQQHGK